ncbi:hypothetical protein DE146DRAFT_388783 [Phaeosphaeria sp. MPI-PUGE-AT-0046c]|nr:hypothetical protein DE146DRAFT_388783 [Phaeosphaeria sp. MPI-PUGE-AT-0046c]
MYSLAVGACPLTRPGMQVEMATCYVHWRRRLAHTGRGKFFLDQEVLRCRAKRGH